MTSSMRSAGAPARRTASAPAARPGPVSAETPVERGARLLRKEPPTTGQAEVAWAAAMKQMGIQGEPISAEKLREMIVASGVNPEGNEFSRGIIEMREE